MYLVEQPKMNVDCHLTEHLDLPFSFKKLVI